MVKSVSKPSIIRVFTMIGSDGTEDMHFGHGWFRIITREKEGQDLLLVGNEMEKANDFQDLSLVYSTVAKEKDAPF
jgi:hypothetical protein